MSKKLVPPIFLRWIAPDSEERHIFIRSDWIMDQLFETMPFEDAQRAWAKMWAIRIRFEEGDEAADEFLEAFGVTEH
jgi:hypothetical protein